MRYKCNREVAPSKGFGPLTDWLTASRSTGLSHDGTTFRSIHSQFKEYYLRIIVSPDKTMKKQQTAFQDFLARWRVLLLRLQRVSTNGYKVNYAP